MTARTAIALSFVALSACTADRDAGTDAAPPAPAPLAHSFEPFDLGPGEELSSFCQSWTLDNDETLYVNAVEMEAGYGFHHSNWFWVPDNLFDGPDGTWRCDDRGFSEASAGIRGGVLFAQSTQATSETQAFPDGVAVPIPPHSRIVGGIHLLNAGGQRLSSNIDLTLHPIAGRDAHTRLSGLSIQYEALEIQPHGRSVFSVECDLADEYERQVGRAPDFGIYYVLPHYHDLGRRMTVEAVGSGPDATVYETESDIGEPLGAALEPPFDMTDHSGLRLSCEFDNPRDEVVGWGIGDQEMCIFLAFTDAPITIGGGVQTRQTAGNERTTVDGVPHFEHDCQLFTVPANH